MAFIQATGGSEPSIDDVLKLGICVTVQWFRRQRRYASVMALSLVLKLIIAGLHVPMALAAFGASAETNAASPQAQSFLQFVICTPSGV